MNKKFIAVACALITGACLFAGGSTEKDKAAASTKDVAGKTLNVVATSAYKELFDAFTAKTQVKVEFLSMSSGEVLARTRAEGKSMADVWFGGGLDAFMAAKADGLLENYTSPNAKDIPAQYKDPDGAWIAKGITVVGFIGNKGVLAEKKLLLIFEKIIYLLYDLPVLSVLCFGYHFSSTLSASSPFLSKNPVFGLPDDIAQTLPENPQKQFEVP